MKNITLAIEDEVLDAVRLFAAERNTTVNALVRAELKRIAEAEGRVAQARRQIRALAAQSQGEMGPVTWARDDLHER